MPTPRPRCRSGTSGRLCGVALPVDRGGSKCWGHAAPESHVTHARLFANSKISGTQVFMTTPLTPPRPGCIVCGTPVVPRGRRGPAPTLCAAIRCRTWRDARRRLVRAIRDLADRVEARGDRARAAALRQRADRVAAQPYRAHAGEFAEWVPERWTP
jgi:hypothetical protein